MEDSRNVRRLISTLSLLDLQSKHLSSQLEDLVLDLAVLYKDQHTFHPTKPITVKKKANLPEEQ